MRAWLTSRTGGLIGFTLVCALVAGGLAWATRAALRLEAEGLAAGAAADQAERLRLALWRLDSRISTILAREDSRLFNHYSAVYAPPVALTSAGSAWPSGSVLEPSPLLAADLPSWMLLHFQTDERGWESPQVPSSRLHAWLNRQSAAVPLTNVTPQRQRLLAELSRELPARDLLTRASRHAGATTISDRVLLALRQAEQAYANNSVNVGQNAESYAYREYFSRSGQQSKLNNYTQENQLRLDKGVAVLNTRRNGEEWFQNPPLSATNGTLNRPRVPVAASANTEVVVRMSPTVGVWLPTASGRDRLVALRLVRLEGKEICQGILLDDEQLSRLLAEEVQDLLAGAVLVPVRGEPPADQLSQMMTALPFRLDPGAAAAPDDPGWTGLRIGLTLAWAAALVALAAVGLGGWSLLDLSERRIRFVSAVTHELRTPLTTLRLYLDMLLGGLVKGEQQRNEYLQTLHGETDRLTRLVANVLDFSRLENQRPRCRLAPLRVAEWIEATATTWAPRCAAAGKTLVVEAVPPELTLTTDATLLGQIVANLLDNACKYSREADDPRLWLRVVVCGPRLAFEVEDRGPGVPAGEQAVIFRPFRRGRQTDATTGGVGLGLALARQWAELLGGRLTLRPPAAGGACFRVELPR